MEDVIHAMRHQMENLEFKPEMVMLNSSNLKVRRLPRKEKKRLKAIDMYSVLNIKFLWKK